MSTQPITGIVAGYDGSEAATRALDWAAAEARARGLPLTVMHVWEIHLGGPVAMPMVGLGAIAQETLDEGVAYVRKNAPDLEVRGVLGRGQVAAELIEAARTADMIVLGPRGIGGFAGLLLGSVSAQVVAHAPCPVVVVPAPRGDGGCPASLRGWPRPDRRSPPAARARREDWRRTRRRTASADRIGTKE